ncbi:hypothetical protein RHMOL_Rhmol07G0049100 [Rhododendron molle]|uniref:Uncharacterized protein n=1 Tax=Rhododendron molle TaxID=49168 RepID=A0ACC0MXT7_RHOML|nr:hypothetical protein RHMOL_Rhmol07G0049100 [Rhododendron molle]
MASSSSSLFTEQVHPPQQPGLSNFLPKPSSSSSFTPLDLKCLEFLSCLQTDQIMPIHKINDVVIPTLIHYLCKCNPRPCSSEGGDHSPDHSPLQETYDKIDGDLSDIKKTLERLEEWEDCLNTLTKKLMLYDWEALCSEETNAVEEIPKVHKMVSGLKFHISLPLETSLAPKSSDIYHLPIPENAASILKCSEIFPETDTFVNFKKRYDTLNSQQQQSLLYLSFFPENSLIRKKVPAYLWIGEGVIQSTDEGDWEEEIVDLLFKELIAMGFVEPFEEKVKGDFNVFEPQWDLWNHTASRFHFQIRPSQHIGPEILPGFGEVAQGDRFAHKANALGRVLLDEMPTGLASLLELRVLKGFIVGRSRKGTKQCTLGDLVKLEKLRKLSLYAYKETTGENGELNCLSEFRSLRILAISWIAPIPDPQSKPIKKLNGTSVASPWLPASLEKLDLRCWPLSSMPSWIKPSELNSLKKLYIRGGKLSCMQIIQAEVSKSPPWMVKILRLKFLRELKMDWEEVGTLFPSLAYLEKVDCPQRSSFGFEGVRRF